MAAAPRLSETALLLLLALALSAVIAAGAERLPETAALLARAPQLAGFAGGGGNLDRLASGLSKGASITLSSINADGMRENVSLKPSRARGLEETAQVLLAAQATLDEHGLAAPSAWEIAVVLIGGTLPTPEGLYDVPSLVAPADPRRALVVSVDPFAGSQSNYRSLVEGLRRGRPITLISREDRRTRVTFTAEGKPLSETEVRRVLLAASDLLSAHGMEEPTPMEVKAALVGGKVSVGGRELLLRGVLEQRPAK